MASPAYRFTTFDLNSCVELARIVQDNGGRLSSAELARLAGYRSDNNGSFNTRLANARLFGLLDGPSSALEPSPRLLDIIHPDFPATESRARIAAFEAVPLFHAVLEQYHGRPLPDEGGLRNALTTRWQITPEKAPAVLARLMDSAEQAGLFQVAGNRTTMIRPTIHEPSQGRPAARDDIRPAVPEPIGVPGQVGTQSGARGNKVIDGALDLLPSDQTWDEDSLKLWLHFFEDALRLYYKLPRGSSTPATD
ncbi:MAG TPA: hypothetical protein VFZ97_08370 [Acidimicrobiales bacterium]